ncbi:ribosomal protein S18-alanine N-acetyltransferase [Caldicellulosiruptoraceae bacterium PP1]
MTHNDIDEVYEIEVLSFSEPWSKTLFEDELENELAHYFVYEESGKVIGYVGMYHILNEGHITNIAVNPDFRGKGIGKELLLHILKYAKENDIVALTLEVRKSNIVAQNLYKSFGFKEAGIRKNYYKNPTEDAVIMWLYLG